ncbi:SlyX family protein [Glaciecola sp. 1036]|uniref:SlyX family protein n=1 Tax=Alteromonadaceae TaxID=72275 RepID=UPI003D0882D9
MANTIQDAEERIDYLEIKVAYQEDTIEQLNQTIIKQQLLLNELTERMQFLGEKLASIQVSNLASGDQVEIPPHY